MPRIYGFNDFIRHVYGKDDSIFTCVEGPNGSGKTDFNILQLERIHALGLGVRFGSNMSQEDPEAIRPSFEMDFIEDFATLEKTCRMLNPDPTKPRLKKYFFFLSELGKFVPRDEAWRKENIKFIQKLQTVRKYGLSMLTDAIDRVDARVLSPRFFHGKFEKPFSDHPQFATYTDFRTHRTFTFKELPRCKTWFATHYSANFYLEPQTQDDLLIPLNPDHEKVKRYLDAGSWRKAGIHPQDGKRALRNVLDYHMKHCLRAIQSEEAPQEISTTSEGKKTSSSIGI